jgi:hypothetical protein
MNKSDIKLGSAVAIATFVAAVLAPVGLADTTVDVANNGANSTTNVVVNNTSGGSGVSQTNHSVIINEVSVKQTTGKNTASGNTGGDTVIETGDATSTVNVTVGGSTNEAVTIPCGGCATNTTVNVSGNGARSDNTVVVNNGVKNGKTKGQKNTSFIVNGVSVKQVTGKNKAKYNTGGTTAVTTGTTTSTTSVSVTGSSNTSGVSQ